jgi:hypothetical protein
MVELEGRPWISVLVGRGPEAGRGGRRVGVSRLVPRPSSCLADGPVVSDVDRREATASELAQTRGIRLFNRNIALRGPLRVVTQGDFCPVL